MTTAAVVEQPAGRGRRRSRYTYTPTRRQALAHAFLADELLYGGAAGGGKTDWLLAEVLGTLLDVPGSNGVIFRRTYPDLSRPGGIIHRLLDRLPQPPYRYNATDHLWTLPNGSRLELGHIQRDSDVYKYQGAEYIIIAFDQVEQFTEYQYRYLLHRLRASGEVARKLEALGLYPRAVSTANPGGVGHSWVKARWVDLGAPEQVYRPAPSEDDPAPAKRAFVPARVDDNPHIDAGYVDRLRRLPEDDRRAMLEGDWDVYAGQRFRAFRRAIHVVDPEQLPISLGGVPRALGVDYGLDAPYCALWGARLADGLVVVYREDYKAGLTAPEQAARILDLEPPGERAPGRPLPVWLDPSTWARSATVRVDPKGPKPADPSAAPVGSIARAYQDAGLPARRARNDRLAGVAKVADKLRVRRDGLPRLLIYSTCTNLIRTLPGLVRDPHRPEDVDTKGEDHAYDALRYLLLGLESAPPPPAEQPDRGRPARGVPAATADLTRAGF